MKHKKLKKGIVIGLSVFLLGIIIGGIYCLVPHLLSEKPTEKPLTEEQILVNQGVKIQDKEKKNTLLYAICLIEIFTIADLLLMNSFNIFVPLNVILSIVLIIKDRREKSV